MNQQNPSSSSPTSLNKANGTVCLFVMNQRIFGSVDSRLCIKDEFHDSNYVFAQTDLSKKYRVYGGNVLALACGTTQVWRECFRQFDEITATRMTQGIRVAVADLYVLLQRFHTQYKGRARVYVAGFTKGTSVIYMMDYNNLDHEKMDEIKKVRPYDVPEDGIIMDGSGADIAKQFTANNALSPVLLETKLVSSVVFPWIEECMANAMFVDRESGGYCTVIGICDMPSCEPIIKTSSLLQCLIQFDNVLDVDKILFIFYPEQEKDMESQYFNDWADTIIQESDIVLQILSPIGKIDSTDFVLRGLKVTGGGGARVFFKKIAKNYNNDDIWNGVRGWKFTFQHKTFYISAASTQVLQYLKHKIKLLDQSQLISKHLPGIQINDGKNLRHGYVDPDYLQLGHLKGFMCGQEESSDDESD